MTVKIAINIKIPFLAIAYMIILYMDAFSMGPFSASFTAIFSTSCVTCLQLIFPEVCTLAIPLLLSVQYYEKWGRLHIVEMTSCTSVRYKRFWPY